MGYTNCKAGWLSFAQGSLAEKVDGGYRIRKNELLHFEWGDGIAGENNPVVKQVILFRLSQDGTKPLPNDGISKKIEVSPKAGSMNVRIADLFDLDAYEGYKITFAIWAGGDYGYDSDFNYATNIAVINITPKITSLSASKTILPYGGDTVQFNLSAFDADKHKFKFKYRIKNNNQQMDWMDFNPEEEIKITTTTTFEFCAQDIFGPAGEKGPSKEITIKVGAELILDASVEGTKLSSQPNDVPNNAKYIEKLQLQFYSTGGYSARAYIASLVFGNSSIDLGSIHLNQGDSMIRIIQVRDFLKNKYETSGLTYYINIKCTDMAGTSAKKQFGPFYLTPYPQIVGWGNKEGNIYTEGTLGVKLVTKSKLYVRDKLYVKFNKIDDGYKYIQFFKDETSTGITNKISITGTEVNGTIQKYLASGTSFNGLRYEFFDVNGKLIGSRQKLDLEVFRTDTIEDGEFGLNPNAGQTNWNYFEKLYEDKISFNFNIRNFCDIAPFNTNGTPNTSFASKAKDFGLVVTNGQVSGGKIRIYGKLNNTASSPKILYIQENGSNNSILQLSLSSNDMKNIVDSLVSSKNGIYKFSFDIEIIDFFDQILKRETIQKIVTIDFNGKISLTNWQIETNFTNQSNIDIATQGLWLKEQMPLYFTGTLKTYNRIVKINFYQCYSEKQFQLIKTLTPTSNTPSAETALITNKFESKKFYTIPEISFADQSSEGYKQVYFKVEVITEGPTESFIYQRNNKNVSIPLYEHSTNNNFKITYGEYSAEEKTVKLKCSYTYLGGSKEKLSKSAKIYASMYDTNKGTLIKEISQWPEETEEYNLIEIEFFLSEISASILESSKIYFVVEVTTTLGNNGEYITTKTFENSPYRVFSATPTVNYRKNKIGVNITSKDLEESYYDGAVLVIRQTNDKNKIYFGISFNNYFDLEKGILSFASPTDDKVRKIDFNTGKISGFQISSNIKF